MRHRNMNSLLALSILGAMTADPGPAPMLKDGPPRRRRPEPEPDSLQQSSRERLEIDLRHAEEALDRAATPGARRKAQRKVDAIRSRLEADHV